LPLQNLGKFTYPKVGRYVSKGTCTQIEFYFGKETNSIAQLVPNKLGTTSLLNF